MKKGKKKKEWDWEKAHTQAEKYLTEIIEHQGAEMAIKVLGNVISYYEFELKSQIRKADK